MATTFEARRQQSNGPATATAQQVTLEPPPRRRVRVPELLVGAALVVGFSLAAVVWHTSTTERQPALALARSVVRGEVIEADDVRVVQISTDDPIARLGRDESAAVVGRIALFDMPAGTLLTRGSVASAVSVGEGEGLVGLALDPGQIPSSTLVPGDLVNVVAGPAAGPAEEGQADGLDTGPLAEEATVYAVEDLGTQGRKFVSVKLAEDDANRVAAAAERGPVRLVLVGRR